MRAKREIFGFGILPFLIAAIVYLPAWPILVVLGVAVTGAGRELLTIARSDDRPCGSVVPLILLALVMAASWGFGPLGTLAAAGLALVVLPGIQMTHPRAPQGSLNAVTAATFTVLYLGITAACMGWIRLLPQGPDAYHLIMLFLGGIWGGDTGAYYVGKNLGRHKMAPRISPKKTWEGLFGGIAGSLIAATLLKLILGASLEWSHLMAVTAIAAIIGPIGDLVVSQFKRDTGVKDASTLLPGHGGLLDRADSLLYAAPPYLAYLLIAGIVSFQAP